MKRIPDILQLKAYLNGTCSTSERMLVEEWLSYSPKNAELLESLAISNEEINVLIDKENIKKELFRKIYNHNHQYQLHSSLSKYNEPLSFWFRVAALLVLFCSVSYITYWISDKNEKVQDIQEVFSPSRVVKTFTLNDGSKVSLNGKSKLRFPKKFSEEERVVYLEGEAFFKVKSDRDWPFIVHTGNITTHVLGTSFNVNFNTELNKVDVALVEGKVFVTALEKETVNDWIILNPNEWISYSPNDRNLHIKKGVKDKILWRKGIFKFDGKTLTQVARELEHWYSVDIKIKNLKLQDCMLRGTFKNESLENVLKGLQFVVGIEYEIFNNTVILSGEICN